LPARANRFTKIAMLVADSLTHTRWGKTLFKNLGFCLLQGSLAVLLGKSQPAKTSLLEMLAGNKKPKHGQIRFEGQPVLGHGEYQSLVAHIGRDNGLKPRMGVKENILRFIPPSGAENLANAAMRYFKLTAYAERPAALLPLHMQRRVALARLLAVPCPLWLLHHAPDSLDAEGNELLYMLISNRCNQDGIVVMAAETADFVSPCLPLDLGDFT
jgi:heme exporter protein A